MCADEQNLPVVMLNFRVSGRKRRRKSHHATRRGLMRGYGWALTGPQTFWGFPQVDGLVSVEVMCS